MSRKMSVVNLQVIWQEVSENKMVYSCPWSFGLRSLRFRECGLLEASRRLKNHKQLEETAKPNPENQDTFEDNLVDTYPQRSQQLVCDQLYELQGLDEQGQRKYRKLNKPKLPNHKLFDPENENQRDYSLVLLFCPFRDESTFLHHNETAEAAFNTLVSSKSSRFHAKLKVYVVSCIECEENQ